MKRVFIVSYPRSGNMFVRTLLAYIAFPNEDWTTKNITKRFAPDLYHIGDISKEWFTNPGIYKSHAKYNESIEPVIYVYRHGLDVANSMYNRLSRRPSFNMPWEDYYSLFINGHRKWGSWSDHVETWLFKRTKKVPFISICYENLILNPVPEVRKMVNFLEWYRDGDEIDKAIEDTAVFYHNSYKGQAKTRWIEFDFVYDFYEKNGDLLRRLDYGYQTNV